MAGGVLHTLGGIPAREYFSVREYFRILTLGRMQIDVKHPGLRLDGCSRTEPRVAELRTVWGPGVVQYTNQVRNQ